MSPLLEFEFVQVVPAAWAVDDNHVRTVDETVEDGGGAEVVVEVVDLFQ